MATERGIEHILCDPNKNQRRDLGYRDGMELEISTFMSAEGWGMSSDEIHLRARATEMGRYFPVRERFWLDQLGERWKRDGVFICGNAHIEGFTELLKARGIPFRIVERGIGVTPEEKEDWERIVEYLKAHPELKETR
jgi:hypothetical protein